GGARSTSPRPSSAPSPRRSIPRSASRCSSTGWPSPCCSPTSCRGGSRSPGSRSGRDAGQLGLRDRRLRHRRGRALRLLAPSRPPGPRPGRPAAGRREDEGRVNRKAKFIGGGLVIVAALAYLIYAGVSQSVVYFVTP